ncbi:hypothetical protein JOQ06_024835 [Pogonophryne albipinna]|uniref:Uncharacterized protein n=1 Tax=Pogonophryne albipinna TaxID=1090488 RepID=A0AAD6AT67_9TELE|nr:hypothetical protein JOQ06_024835 [Pogonophryne albipinna]
MEEEIKKVTELFVDSQSKLEQCTVDLDEKQQRLEETMDACTSDVSGLHEKQDRKKKVEQHNSEIQQSFSQRMVGAFSSMQRCVQEERGPWAQAPLPPLNNFKILAKPRISEHGVVVKGLEEPRR